MRKCLLLLVVLVACMGTAGRAGAQVVRFGTIGGGAQLPSGLHESALGAVFQLQPVSGLTFDVRPTWARVAGTATTGTFSSSGFTDLPLDAGYWRTLPGPLSPGLGASFGITLPVGDTAKGLGSGQASVGGSLGGSLSPTDKLSLGVNAWREFSGSGWSSALVGPNATSLSFQATYDVTEHANIYAGYATDVGATDSLGTPRSLMAGLTLPVGGRVALSIDGAHGLTSAAPSWVVSIGLGTAFAGINPIGANSPIGRLATALGHGVNRGRGRGHVGGTTTHGNSGR